MSGLDPFRRRLDELDEQIVRLLGERFETCREIAAYKQAHDIAMMQPGRVAVVKERYMERAVALGMPLGFTGSLVDLLIEATCEMEDELMSTDAAMTEGSQ